MLSQSATSLQLYGSTVRGRAGTRIGGHLLAESLRALGAELVFGLPGVHTLPMWEGLRATGLPVLGFRQELNAGFAADGYARVTGRPAALLVSTGPGALMTLPAVMEASTAFVPVVVVSSQIESAAIGKGRGELHELPDQAASFAPLVKWTARPSQPAEIPSVLAEAWRRAAAPPPGPVYVEIPYDVLLAPAPGETGELEGTPPPSPLPPAADLDRAAAILAGAERPLLVAGGGAVRSGAARELLELAARLDAPVATTYTGKGAVPERHPLALGSAWDDAAHRELVATADAVLVVGSWLGYELADSFGAFQGTLVHVDAAPERIGRRVPALALVGDARGVLQALLARIGASGRSEAALRVAAVRERVERGLREQPDRLALDVLEVVEQAIAGGATAAWDSTILAYAACWYLRADEPRSFLYPAGSSTLGYALPAALGAAAALPGTPTLAVVGDGGFQYALSELATAREHGLGVAVLVLDDGGYGILREYQQARGFAPAGVDLERPDLVQLGAAFGLPARRSSPAQLADDLAWALGREGPALVALPARPTMPVPRS
jgi:acetolactate synthase-1/2/3 large subunit